MKSINQVCKFDTQSQTGTLNSRFYKLDLIWREKFFKYSQQQQGQLIA
ncbi:unnamed protein product [Paramecium octaurelia]|uniref:Uncharacterized protein n=1 Tax=Paramecium octaurelia TaxID=43137 RepID=A0A8S1WR54_PAROT|nr:unnamed protein product [Paramecium octaurelia]